MRRGDRRVLGDDGAARHRVEGDVERRERVASVEVGVGGARVEIGVEVGVSGHHGAWNRFLIDGVRVDERRELTIAVLDGEFTLLGLRVSGEAAVASVDVPPSLRPTYATRQAGWFVDLARDVGAGLVSTAPGSVFTLKARVDAIDLDTGAIGQHLRQVSGQEKVPPTLAPEIGQHTVEVLRAAGIPARYATGFAVLEYSAIEGAYVVRTRHAHAWTRAFVDGRWLEVDTTPPDWAAEEEAEAPVWQGLMDLLRYLGFRWSMRGEFRAGDGWYWVLALLAG